MKIYEELLKLNKNGVNCVLITVIDKKGHGPAKPGFKMILMENGKTIGTVGGGELEYLSIQKGISVFEKKQNIVQAYYLGESEQVIDKDKVEKTKMICGGSISLFFEFLGVEEPLYIFGAGHVGEAILYHIKRLNYYPILIDSREEMLKKFSDEIPVFTDIPALKEKRGIEKRGYFVIATHSHDIDYNILKEIINEDCDPAYIGMIASKKKSNTILTNIKKDFVNKNEIKKIHTPIGLNIGGSTADEIAISIIAELQMVKYNKKDLIWK